MKKVGLVALVAMLTASLVSCVGADSRGAADFPSTFPGAQWSVRSPESQGIDSTRLLALMEDLEERDLDIDAVVIARNGELVLEAYHAPYRSDDLHRIWSCTKSVISTLVGIAYGEGLIGGTDDLVAEQFAEYAQVMQPAARENLRLEHLLTMTTGLDARDSYLYRWVGLTDLRRSDDRVAFSLSRPPLHRPGSHFDYSNQASFLLGALVDSATESSLPEFAQARLFEPLGIDKVQWDIGTDGIVDGWGGLWMTARDLARFGWLIAQEGKWDDTQIVPEDWIEEATTAHVAAGTLQPGYGYQWWISEDELIMALGYSGQYLIIDPAKSLVVVFISSLEDRYFRVPEDLFRRHIWPAVSSQALPDAPSSVRELADAAAKWSRHFGEAADIPRELAPALNVPFALRENPYGLETVEFRYLDGDFSYVETYGDSTVRYRVGIEGSYLLSDYGGRTYAVAADLGPGNSFRMRELGLGQAYWNEYLVVFDGEDITIDITHSNGVRRTLRSY